MRAHPRLRAAPAVTGAALFGTPARGWEPGIAGQADWRPRLPLTVLVGGADDWTQPGPCREVAGRSRLKFIEYAGYHGLDAPNAKVRVARGFGGVKGGAADVGPTRPRAAAIKELTGVLSAARDELLRCPRRPPQF